jgi:formate hydrogenlyase subunit 6/NADH:ubiquinone oxidoreductase subunit I
MSYFRNIKNGIKTTTKGLSLTLRHFWAARKSKGSLNVRDKDYFEMSNGRVTLQYPHEKLDVPDHGRYQLDCEIDDCIVCDKCAKICPVDCIEIEVIKSPELIRTTSDGSPVRLHAAKFDIDMAKCCFCGLCTTVCPTECLTMNSEYDYSVVDITALNFAFANLTESEAQQKRELYDQFVAEKEALKVAVLPALPVEKQTVGFKPKMFPAKTDAELPKPAFKPSFKPSNRNKPVETVNENTEPVLNKVAPKFVPKMAPKTNLVNADEIIPEPINVKPAGFMPKLKPTTKSTEVEKDNIKESENIKQREAAPTVNKFVPKLKPKS